MIKNTYNPMLREEAYQPSFFSRFPSPGPNSAILLIAGDNIQQALCIRPGVSVKPSELRKNKYNRLVEIDTSTHSVELEFSLLSKDNVSSFIVKAGMVAAVTDPLLFYAERLTNAAERIEGELEPVFQECAESFSLEDISGFRNELRRELSGFTLTQCGITISGCHVNVRGDENYQSHLRRKRSIVQNNEIEREKALSSQQISELYKDPVIAAISGVADGSISIMDAQNLIRENRLADFNQQMEYWDRITQQMIKLRDAGLVSEEQLQGKVYPFLDGLLSKTSISGQISETPVGRIAESAEQEEESSEFAPFDEE